MACHIQWGAGCFTERGGPGASIYRHIQTPRTRCRNQLVASLPSKDYSDHPALQVSSFSPSTPSALFFR